MAKKLDHFRRSSAEIQQQQGRVILNNFLVFRESVYPILIYNDNQNQQNLKPKYLKPMKKFININISKIEGSKALKLVDNIYREMKHDSTNTEKKQQSLLNLDNFIDDLKLSSFGLDKDEDNILNMNVNDDQDRIFANYAYNEKREKILSEVNSNLEINVQSLQYNNSKTNGYNNNINGNNNNGGTNRIKLNEKVDAEYSKSYEKPVQDGIDIDLINKIDTKQSNLKNWKPIYKGGMKDGQLNNSNISNNKTYNNLNNQSNINNSSSHLNIHSSPKKSRAQSQIRSDKVYCKISSISKSLNHELGRISPSYGSLKSYNKFMENPESEQLFENTNQYYTYKIKKESHNKKGKLLPLGATKTNIVDKIGESFFKYHKITHGHGQMYNNDNHENHDNNDINLEFIPENTGINNEIVYHELNTSNINNSNELNIFNNDNNYNNDSNV